MIDKIGHYSITSPASVYDEEALTALELAGRTAAKVNECVDEVNQIPKKVTAEFAENVRDGTFDAMIDEYAGNIETRVDTILGGLPENPTAMDAEVIDLRVDADSNVHANAGTAVRQQFLNSLRIRDAITLGFTPDANQINTTGIYFLSSARDWANLPDTTNDVGFLIVTEDPRGYGRLAQIFISYDGKLAVRHFNLEVVHEGGTTPEGFTEWSVLTSEKYVRNVYDNIMVQVDKALKFEEVSNTEPVNVNDYVETGCFMFGSSHTVVNAPSDNGMLLVYRGRNNYNVYQTWHGYDGEIYTRNYVYNAGFTPWERVLHAKDVLTSGGGELSHKYHVKPVNANTFYVEQRGVKGVVRYVFKFIEDEEGRRAFGIRGVYLVNKAGEATVLVGEGADIDGVLKFTNESEHVGGVHGFEDVSEFHVLINGVSYENIGDIVECDTDFIRIYTYSAIKAREGGEQIDDVTRTWQFDGEGLLINNMFETGATSFDTLHVERIECAMMSVQKDVINHYILGGNGKDYCPQVTEFINKDYDTVEDIFDTDGYYHEMTFAGADVTVQCLFNGFSLNQTFDDGDQGFLKLKNYEGRVKMYYYTEALYTQAIYTTHHIKITY